MKEEFKNSFRREMEVKEEELDTYKQMAEEMRQQINVVSSGGQSMAEMIKENQYLRDKISILESQSNA